MPKDARSHADKIIPAETRVQITEFFIARGFSKVWLGLVSDGGELAFLVLPAELAQVDDVRAMELDLTMVSRTKIWIIGYGIPGPSETFFDNQGDAAPRA